MKIRCRINILYRLLDGNIAKNIEQNNKNLPLTLLIIYYENKNKNKF